MARSTGWCENPVRLSGTTHEIDPATGEIYSTYSTDSEPDGHLLKACGTRRATVCEPCSARYRADAWHLIVAGLKGGKGVPEAASTHPILFVTLTAPSFGLVHSRRLTNESARRCRPGYRWECSHGRSIRCHEIHKRDDIRLGEPLCAACFDYERAILWNAHATELWRRTTIGVQRELAKAVGIASSRFADHARLSYAKVVEYQARGLVHLHVVIRLDGPAGPDEPPPSDLTIDVFESAVVSASQRSHVSFPTLPGIVGEARWGEQIDVRRVTLDTTPPGAVAAYIAKYATKSTDAYGRLDHRLRESDLAALDLRPHLKRLVTTAWDLGGRPEFEHLKLRLWAHTLGFRGHWLTKSRRYSTTLGALRGARAEWTATLRDAVDRPPEVSAVKDWRYVGRGWDNEGDAWLAQTAAAEASEIRTLARQARLAEKDL